jgi:hypothetical protein
MINILFPAEATEYPPIDFQIKIRNRPVLGNTLKKRVKNSNNVSLILQKTHIKI